MSVLLPLTRIASRAIRPRLFSGNQEGVLGGVDLPVPRMGDRFAVDVVTTQLRQDDESRLLIAALTEATTRDAKILLPTYHVGHRSFAGAATVVDGAGQLGSILNIRAVAHGGIVRRGHYLTIVHAGVGFLHMITAEVQAQDGRMAVPVWPMLRFRTVDAEPVAIETPYIEGRLVGFDKGATFVRNRVEPLQFAIEERR